MKVRDVMSVHVVTIPVGMTYEQVVDLLQQEKISGAPVLDADGVLVGIVSEKDLYRALYPQSERFYGNPEAYLDEDDQEWEAATIHDHPIERFMVKDVVTTHPNAPIMRVGAMMLARGIHRLPVMEDGKMVGMVTRKDIYQKTLRYHLHKK